MSTRSRWATPVRRTAAMMLFLSGICSGAAAADAAGSRLPADHGSFEAAGSPATPDWNWLIVTDGPDQEVERDVLIAALRLLPRLPARVAVIDAQRARPEVRSRLLRLDAFIVTRSPVVYVVRQSVLLDGARRGSSVHVHALAAVLWHELAHVDGADEREARRREQALWMGFVRDQKIDNVAALRYLKLLAGRPDDQLLTKR